MKKVLITEGNGGIGKYVVRSLMQMGYEVYATYNRNKPSHILCHWHKVNLFIISKHLTSNSAVCTVWWSKNCRSWYKCRVRMD